MPWNCFIRWVEWSGLIVTNDIAQTVLYYAHAEVNFDGRPHVSGMPGSFTSDQSAIGDSISGFQYAVEIGTANANWIGPAINKFCGPIKLPAQRGTKLYLVSYNNDVQAIFRVHALIGLEVIDRLT